jgi:hypothetical protein
MSVGARLAILFVLVLLGASLTQSGAAAAAADRGVVLAQQDLTGQEEEAEGQEGQPGKGEGQAGSGAESGAAGETEEGASAESGPPWTYQMARLSLALLVVLAAAIALAYYRLVAKRQRGEI